MTDNKPIARYKENMIPGHPPPIVEADDGYLMLVEDHESALAELRNLAETCLEIAEKSVQMAAELHERQIAVRQQADRLNSWITSKKAELIAMLEEGK